MDIKDVIDLKNKALILFKSEYPNIDIQIGWDFSWSSRRTYGQCSYVSSNRVLIKISQRHWLNSAREGVWNTICHELCHAYNMHHDGHGYFWKRIAAHMSQVCNTDIKRVGGASESKSNLGGTEGANPVAKFDCPCCGRTYYIFRRGKAYQRNGVGFTCGVCHTVLNYTKLR